MITILIVAFLFGILVFVHEFGHFYVARKNGVEVEEFGFGFPPRILGWKRKKDSTLYSINLLPLGGFVKLKGEDNASTAKGAFGAASTLVKSKILLAGVGMNLVTAYVLLVALCLTGLPFMFEGQYSFGSASSTPKQLIVAVVGKDSPAEKAGIKAGEFILSGNGSAFSTESDLTKFTKAYAGKQVELAVKSKNVSRNISVTLRQPDSKEGFLGVTPQQTFKQSYNLWESLVTSFGLLGQLVWMTLVGVGALFAKIPALVVGIFANRGVPEAASGAVGPVGIFFLVKHVSALGISYLAQFAMAVSVTLAVFNALPIPALDGGRLALILFQKVTGKEISERAESMVHSFGFVFLIGLMVVITVFDVRRFL